MSALLQGSELVHEYPGPLRALDGVTIALEGGEFLAVSGPNGAGKSTLLKVLGGLLPATSGRLLLDGRELRELSPRERARRIAVVPQGLSAYPDVLVRDFVLGGRYGHLGAWRRRATSDHRAVEAALAQADAVELGGRLLTEISGGQRQRVLVARALAQEANLLLVDEPTSSLDPEHQLAVFALLARLAKAGRAVCVVTHDLNLASQFATRILLMRDGREVARGTAEQVLVREVLEPVYGPHLRYGSWPVGSDGEQRPFVVPWRPPEDDA